MEIELPQKGSFSCWVDVEILLDVDDLDVSRRLLFVDDLLDGGPLGCDPRHGLRDYAKSCGESKW